MTTRRGGPKAGAKIKKLTDREKADAGKKSRSLLGGHWEVRNGKKVWVKD